MLLTGLLKDSKVSMKRIKCMLRNRCYSGTVTADKMH